MNIRFGTKNITKIYWGADEIEQFNFFSSISNPLLSQWEHIEYFNDFYDVWAIEFNASANPPLYGFRNRKLIRQIKPSTDQTKITEFAVTPYLEMSIRFAFNLNALSTLASKWAADYNWYIIRPDKEYVIFTGNILLERDLIYSENYSNTRRVKPPRSITIPLHQSIDFIDSKHGDTSDVSFLSGSLYNARIIVALLPKTIDYKPYI